MPLINWNPTYSVKVSTFDKHHRKLINLINILHDSMNAGKGKETLREIINELIEYTDYHFKAEEELMIKYNYPGFAKHRTEHTNFAKKIEDIQRNFDRDDKYVTIEAFTFLKDWLINHILNSDKQYGAFFNNQGVK